MEINSVHIFLSFTFILQAVERESQKWPQQPAFRQLVATSKYSLHNVRSTILLINPA